MDVEVRLPQWGMGMQEGEVVRWLKDEGDPVQADEPLAEIEAAKVAEEVVAPASGTLARIMVGQGRTVPVRELLAVISTDEDAAASRPAATATNTGADTPSGAGAAHPARRRATPRVRRLAHELGVDLDDVSGSGPGDVVTEPDVRAEATGRPEEGSSTVPMSSTRRAIARRMHQSVQTMAQVTLTREVDVSELVSERQRLADPSEATYTAYVARAASLALLEHPWLNARLVGERIERRQQVHLGVAVSLDAGLLVVVVRDANDKHVGQIAEEIGELSHKARAGTLSPGEASDSTFTVTNLGMYGIDAFTPIINPPEAATLGMGRITDKPARAEGGGVRWEQAMVLSLTFDHRLVDGAPAAAFLDAVSTYLASPGLLAR